MELKPRFTLLEVFFILFIIITFYCMITPFQNNARRSSNRTRTISAAYSIGMTMFAYAEDDIKSFKMPYPLPAGKEKVWGNSKDCWSTSVAELLYKQKYMKKGDEAQLISAGTSKANGYAPMHLNDNSIDKNLFWNTKTELDFQIYCDKDLTSTKKERVVLVATYDNDDIRSCQFSGSGWVVYFSDKTTEFIRRSKSKEFDIESNVKPIISVNAIEGTLTGNGIVLRKDIPKSEGGPGTFGNHFGGGSTELMGKKDTDAIFKALVR